MKPLTIQDLRNELKVAFKENNKALMKEVKTEIRGTVKATEVSLKKYIGKYVGDATDNVLGTMQEMFDERDVTLKDHTNKLDKLSKDMTDVKQDIKFIRQDIKDLNVDFSDKPSRKQFEEFKSSFKNYPMV